MDSERDYLEDPIGQAYEIARSMTIVFYCLALLSVYIIYVYGFSLCGVLAAAAWFVALTLGVRYHKRMRYLKAAHEEDP